MHDSSSWILVAYTSSAEAGSCVQASPCWLSISLFPAEATTGTPCHTHGTVILSQHHNDIVMCIIYTYFFSEQFISSLFKKIRLKSCTKWCTRHTASVLFISYSFGHSLNNRSFRLVVVCHVIKCGKYCTNYYESKNLCVTTIKTSIINSLQYGITPIICNTQSNCCSLLSNTVCLGHSNSCHSCSMSIGDNTLTRFHKIFALCMIIQNECSCIGRWWLWILSMCIHVHAVCMRVCVCTCVCVYTYVCMRCMNEFITHLALFSNSSLSTSIPLQKIFLIIFSI